MSDKLAIAVTGPPVGTLEADAAISVRTRNRSRRPVRIVGCVLVLPMGLRVSADAPGLSYPVVLGGGDTCSDGFSCTALARLARRYGHAGRVALTPIVLEGGGLDESCVPLPEGMRWTPGKEHRLEAFAFDVSQWG
jgi:hypothetical protein